MVANLHVFSIPLLMHLDYLVIRCPVVDGLCLFHVLIPGLYAVGVVCCLRCSLPDHVFVQLFRRQATECC